MVRKKIVIDNPTGLHLRPAGKLRFSSRAKSQFRKLQKMKM